MLDSWSDCDSAVHYRAGYPIFAFLTTPVEGVIRHLNCWSEEVVASLGAHVRSPTHRRN